MVVGSKNIHIVVKPSPTSTCRTLSSSQRATLRPLNASSPQPLASHPRAVLSLCESYRLDGFASLLSSSSGFPLPPQRLPTPMPVTDTSALSPPHSSLSQCLSRAHFLEAATFCSEPHHTSYQKMPSLASFWSSSIPTPAYSILLSLGPHPFLP